MPVEHAADVHVHLHESNLIVEADDAIHTVRTISLPSAVMVSLSRCSHTQNRAHDDCSARRDRCIQGWQIVSDVAQVRVAIRR